MLTRDISALFHALWDLKLADLSRAIETYNYEPSVKLDYPDSVGPGRVKVTPMEFAMLRMYAIGASDTEILEALFQHGFPPLFAVREIRQVTPMHAACRLQRAWHMQWREKQSPFKPICELACCQPAIIRANAANSQDSEGDTPLHWAVRNSVPTEDLDVLIRLGADLNLDNKLRRGPLQDAIDRYDPTVVRYLVSHGAVVRDQDVTQAKDNLTTEQSKDFKSEEKRNNYIGYKQSILDCLIESRAGGLDCG